MLVMRLSGDAKPSREHLAGSLSALDTRRRMCRSASLRLFRDPDSRVCVLYRAVDSHGAYSWSVKQPEDCLHTALIRRMGRLADEGILGRRVMGNALADLGGLEHPEAGTLAVAGPTAFRRANLEYCSS
jgi:hypothetical protein